MTSDDIQVRIVPKSYITDEGVHYRTDLFITTGGRTYYSRLAYPITDPIYEKAAFLRRQERK